MAIDGSWPSDQQDYKMYDSPRFGDRASGQRHGRGRRGGRHLRKTMKDSTHQPLAWIDRELAALDQCGLRRRLLSRTGPQAARLVVDGRELIHFGSNDYLALAADPRLAAAVAEAAQNQGWGSGASPLITGHGQGHRAGRHAAVGA